MSNRFTERAQRVILIAQEEAKRLNHDYVGTEHILLGLIALGEGVAAQVLANLGVDLRRVRSEIEKIVGTGDNVMLLGEIPFTPRAKKVLEYAVEEAQHMGHSYVGTEHLLLGLIREEEGVAAVECMAGRAGHVNYAVIPSVVYTWPELASAGLSESDAQQRGLAVRCGSFPFLANGRARCMGVGEGLVKLVVDAESDRILGVHILGPGASDLIAEAVVAMEFAASAEDLARTVHAHPTLAEAVKEAALAADGRAIHI